MGVPSLKSILDPKYYNELSGGILEAMSKLFPENIKLYIYPTQDEDGRLEHSRDLKLDGNISYLYKYLQENKFILDLKSNMSDQLRVKSREVQKMIAKGDKNWERYVPMVVAKTIKEKQLFGYKQ